MRYKVIFNLGKEKQTVFVDESKINAVISAVNKKQVIEIDGNFYNTAYFVNATKDKTQTKLTEKQNIALENTRERYLKDKTLMVK